MGIQHEKDYLGEYELIHEKPMEYTATVHSTHVVLMVISREKFLNLVKDELSLKCLNDHIARKRSWREELLQKFLTCAPLTKTAESPTSPTIDDNVQKRRSSITINVQPTSDYFPEGFRATSPINNLTPYYLKEAQKTQEEESNLATSLVLEKPLLSTKASSGVFSSAVFKSPGTNSYLETEPNSSSKSSLPYFMSNSKSPRKSFNQTTYDSSPQKKWLDGPFKRETSPEADQQERSADARRSTSINFRLNAIGKTASSIPKHVKLEPLSNSKQAEVRSEARKASKVWSNYLHNDKMMLKKIDEKNRPSIKSKANQSVTLTKAGVDLSNQINEDMMMRDVIAGKHYSPLKEILKRDDSFKGKKKDKEKPNHHFGSLSPDRNIYFNTESNFESPSPLVRSVIMSYRKIGDLRKDTPIDK